jgi:phospholipase C
MPSANIFITNTTDGNAWLVLSHMNSSNGTQNGNWSAAPGQTVGPLVVQFETGLGTEGILDYWAVLLHVRDGSAAGLYLSSELGSFWKECQLESADVGQNITLTVNTTTFDVNLASGGCTGGMMRLTSPSPITNVFVLMLENHSFDNILAMSGIAGITAATASDSNTYDGITYNVQSPAPPSMPTDPPHEFPDVVVQLAGEGVIYQSGAPYPAIDNSGFAASYATSTSEGAVPPSEAVGDIMTCFDTATQLPTTHALASLFAVCDQWFSSLPGPTWPNRFFVHGASSAGLDASPATPTVLAWETAMGFQYPNQSIYQKLMARGIPYRFYNDSSADDLSLYSDDPQAGSVAGAVAQVSALQDISATEINSLSGFSNDLQGFYPYVYTFIEPHYGDVSTTYEGGSSQHPMDSAIGADNLLSAVFGAIRRSPYWNSSLLIVVYDEHGGFYDSVAPGPAVAPGDDPVPGYNVFGFDFTQYGLRVPAMVISPLIPATVDHTLYDHSSILKTLEELVDLEPLTKRDAAANSVLHLLSLSEPRTDVPDFSRAEPRPVPARPRTTAEERARMDTLPVPHRGNLPGVLRIMLKTEVELSGGTPPELAAIQARYAAVRTRGEARAYIEFVMEKLRAVKAERRLAETALPPTRPRR